MKALKAALRKATIEEIVAGVSRYKFSDETQYIPFPATWLNQERWADEVATEGSRQAGPLSQNEKEQRQRQMIAKAIENHIQPIHPKYLEEARRFGIAVPAHVQAASDEFYSVE